QMLGASLQTLVPALGGMLVGQWLRQRFSATLFRGCFFVGLLLLGADLAWRGFHCREGRIAHPPGRACGLRGTS
ncbi:hypothetical protein ACNQPN_29445, partial [Pseudomonas aeruginosa]